MLFPLTASTYILVNFHEILFDLNSQIKKADLFSSLSIIACVVYSDLNVTPGGLPIQLHLLSLINLKYMNKFDTKLKIKVFVLN